MLAEPPFSILDTFNAVDDAIDDNADLADETWRLGLASFGLDEQPIKDSVTDWRGKAKPGDITKAHSTIRQFYRDWSDEGFRAEVEPLLKMILADLDASLATANGITDQPTLLVPGAGLGRILLELCLRGYNATGNEISYHQLLASNFILNAIDHAKQYTIYPFATSFTNVIARTHQLQSVQVPDIHPATALSSQIRSGRPVGEMNMTAGDFVLSYSTPESKSTFDGVVSVFFIDTAPNLIRYIETVHNCLKAGGIWINIGPLLWHFDDRTVGRNDHSQEEETEGSVHNIAEDQGIGEPGSVELSEDEVLHLVSRMGFEIIKHELVDHVSTSDPGARSGGFGYMQDPHSLLQNKYRCSHWVARRL
jgi:hypothetical protein